MPAMGSRLEKNSDLVRKRIQSHEFDNEEGEEYEASKFGGFSDYMRRKKIKLQNLDAQIRSQSVNKPQIFRGIVVHVNGYTQPSLADIHVLIVSHGGGFLQYLDGKTACTHIIASQLTPKKKAEFAKYRIVKPAWVVDSVKAGRILPWDNYRVVDEGVTQKVLGFDNGQIVSQTNNLPQSYKGQTETSWYTSQLKSKIPGSGESRREEFITPVGGGVEEEEPVHAFREDDSDQLGDVESEKEYSPITEIEIEQHAAAIIDNITVPVPMTRPEALIDPRPSTEKRQLTAEEHNAILLQNPHMAKSSTANPDFLNQYYRESRLHHLSAWKAELKAQMQARAIEKSSSQKANQKRLSGTRRYIMHVDFDSFFAAVSLVNNPQLKSKPVVVAHGSGPGSEIASCNYPAREYGVKNGMWMKTALQLCPNINVLPYDYKAYEDASRHFYDSILSIDGIVQSISIDEALIDVSAQCIRAGGSDGKSVSEGSIYREQTKASGLAQGLRASVKEKTGCDVSVGIGGNILLAKIALRKAKPAGQHLIKPEDVLDFIGELPVTSLPGVAYSLGNKLEELGVKLVKDIRGLTKERLTTTLGPKTGEKLWDYSRGIDRTEVGDQVVRKSVSAEVNWGIRFITQQQAEEFVQCLCDELQKRLLENGVKGKQFTMKIMRKAADAGMDPPKNLGHGKCDTFNKSVVLGVATNDKTILGKEAVSILRSYGFSPGELRGLGVQMQRLEPLKPIAQPATPLLEGSQRRLTFKKADLSTDMNTDVATIPAQTSTSNVRQRLNSAFEAIEEVPTPEKPKASVTIMGAIDQLESDVDRPLNILGTQFVLPTQVDPKVLADLPEDIRAKLAPDLVRSSAGNRANSPYAHNKSRSASPYVSDNDYLPNQSQLDPEALAALPDEMKDEIMAHYRSVNKAVPFHHGQSLLPQSPRKTKLGMSTRGIRTTPTKKQKFTSILNKGRTKTKTTMASTLTQSNFVSHAPQRESAKAFAHEEEVSQSFLDELPDDIRAEILAEQKRNRMKLKSGLNLGTTRRKIRPTATNQDLSRGQQKLQLPGQPEKPTFTSRKLSNLSDLQAAMSAWVQEFSDDSEDGPFEEDTTALGQYLSRVVLEEGDMAKCVSVVDWLSYLVSDWPFERSHLRSAWTDSIAILKRMVQAAVRDRGLPPLAFENE